MIITWPSPNAFLTVCSVPYFNMLLVEEGHHVRRLTAASAAIFMFAPAAVQAADLPAPVAPGPAVYAPPAAFRAVTSWGGFYVGGNVGVGMARDHSDFSAGGTTFATADTSLWGALGGVQSGFNWQSGAFVAGVEGDFDELALGPNWSAKLEYLYVDLGTVTNTVIVAGVPTVTDGARVQMNVMRAGVNYRF
jgi:opacity protein-like surface antigen